MAGIKNKNVLVLVGPTCSGKSSVGFLLAKELNGEIISADSRQIYKYLDIGTAKPPVQERKKVTHHFIDELLPEHDFNAGEFSNQARERVDTIFESGKQPIVVGGSGLYIQAFIDGFFEGPSADKEVRDEIYKVLDKNGKEGLLEELRKVDPLSASRMLPSNLHRIIRALEVYKVTGTPISELQKINIPPNFQSVLVGLQWDRSKLYERINERVDGMLNSGLLNEVKSLVEKGYSTKITSLRTVGYQEVFQFFEGKISYDYMVELIKRNSRRYAKRQLTWFRRDERIKWFEMSTEVDFNRISKEIISYFGNISG
ncbi:MAG: tRNA (adenosine(37)-N6)-dimethylallyltransferase MiaA [Bacteroidota bacterium]|nr:tRNA (adenosine(37)-N6)-dimethylallyltransferase MiaA [Bacteroidota bacterium]